MSSDPITPVVRCTAAAVLVLALTGCGLLPSPAPAAELTPTTAAPSPFPTFTTQPPSAAPTLTPTNAPAAALVIDPETAGRLAVWQSVQAGSVLDVQWTPDGQSVVARGDTALLRFRLDPLTGEGEYPWNEGNLLDYSATSGYAALATGDGNLVVRSYLDPGADPILQEPGWGYGASFSPDGQRLAAQSTDEMAVQVWDLTTGAKTDPLKGFETAAPVYSVRIDRSGRYLIWFARAQVQAQEIATGQMGPSRGHMDFITALDSAPDGSALAVAVPEMAGDQSQGMLYRYGVLADSQAGKLALGESITGALAYSPDGRLLAAGSASQLYLVDAQSWQVVAALPVPASVTALEFSPDGRTLAMATADGNLWLYQAVPATQ